MRCQFSDVLRKITGEMEFFSCYGMRKINITAVKRLPVDFAVVSAVKRVSEQGMTDI